MTILKRLLSHQSLPPGHLLVIIAFAWPTGAVSEIGWFWANGHPPEVKRYAIWMETYKVAIVEAQVLHANTSLNLLHLVRFSYTFFFRSSPPTSYSIQSERHIYLQLQCFTIWKMWKEKYDIRPTLKVSSINNISFRLRGRRFNKLPHLTLVISQCTPFLGRMQRLGRTIVGGHAGTKTPHPSSGAEKCLVAALKI